MLLLVASCLFSANVFAEAVEIDGIYYNLVTKAKQAEVTYNPSKYNGTIRIPGTVTYNGVTYSVTSIEIGAFAGCRGLTSVSIPNSVIKHRSGGIPRLLRPGKGYCSGHCSMVRYCF